MTTLLPTIASLPICDLTSDASTTDTIRFDFAGNISANVNFNPVVVGFVEDYFQVDLPTALTITDEPFTGTITPPNDPAQYADGDLVIDFPLVADILGINPDDSFVDVLGSLGITVPSDATGIFDTLGITDVNSAVEFTDKLFNFELDGSGTFTTGVGTTDFVFGYANGINSLIIDGFDPNIVAGGLTGQSTIAAQGTFGVDLVLSEFVEVTNTLGIDLPSDVDSFLATAQAFGVNEIELASGSFNLGVSSVPVSTGV
ncbi:hypothetical protein QT972_33990 [Microcoleus sp. herbarium7]|uniref:hypothetical protein n=1 Tax=Microcoleus sp. herbarium7 TaxID=3055435 RepID=UPI002FCFFDDA